MLLFRPVGIVELALTHASKMTAFPPRLPEQPIFYPVLNEGYATQIARDWNTRVAPFAGYVTRFDVDDAYANRFERHIVGAREHEELWVAAEELSTFNAHILSPISVVSAFFGPSFDGCPAEPSARSLLHGLALAQRAGEPDLARELRAAELATFLYFPYWACPGMELGLDPESLQATLESVRRCWPRVMSAAPLLGRAETVSR